MAYLMYHLNTYHALSISNGTIELPLYFLLGNWDLAQLWLRKGIERLNLRKWKCVISKFYSMILKGDLTKKTNCIEVYYEWHESTFKNNILCMIP